MIVLELLSDRIRVAEIQGGGPAAVRATFAEPLPREISPAAVDQIAAWLRERLNVAGIRKGDAVCLLGRGLVTLKAIRVPVVPDNELAGVVAFAVEGAIHQTGPVVVDYQPGRIQPAADGQQGDEQEVMAAVVSVAVVDAVKAILAKAGLSCRRIGVRPFATRAAWLSGDSAGDEAVALVYSASDSLEVAIWTGEHLRVCRWIAAQAAGPVERIVNEIRRTIAAFHGLADGVDVARIVVLGPDATTLVEPLRTAVSSNTAAFELPGVPADLVSAVGAAAMAAPRINWPIDLLRPKRVSKSLSPSRRSLILASILAAVVLLGGGYSISRAFQNRQANIDSLTSEIASLDQELRKFKPTLERHEIVSEWVSAGDPILDELQEVAALLPDTSDLFLTSLEYNSGQRDTPGNVKLDGLAREQSTITRLQTKLVEESGGRYEVIPRGADPGADVGSFVWHWGLDLAIEPLEPAGYLARADARKKVVEGLKPVEGRTRNNLSLNRSSSGTSSGGSSRYGSYRGDRRADRGDRTDRSARTSDSAAGDSSKFFDDKVESIRKLPAEQREKAIQSEPKFLQKRLRKAIEEKAK